MRYFFLLLLTVLLSLAVSSVASAQDGEESETPLETDRDSFTPATTTAGAGRVIIESGYSFIDNRSVPETHSFPELITRYGVTEWLEIRLGSNYEVGGAANSISGGAGGDGDFDSTTTESEAKVIYGLKAALSEQDGWMPRSVAILQAATPTSGGESATHFIGTYAWGWDFERVFLWDSAIRYGDGNAEGKHSIAGHPRRCSNATSTGSGTRTSSTSASIPTAAPKNSASRTSAPASTTL